MGMKSSVVKGLSGAVTPIWKTSPGDPFTSGDTATATHGSIVFIEIVDGDSMTLNLPPITPDSAGKRVEVINMMPEKYDESGSLTLVADDEDYIEASSPIDVNVDTDLLGDEMHHFWLESNGVDRWSMFAPRSGDYWLFFTGH